MNYLSQNAKIRKSSLKGIYWIYNWGIPAFQSTTGLKTCPKAKQCAVGCYARSGAYRFSNVAKKFESRLALALSASFEETLGLELDKAAVAASKRDKQPLIRIHDSGDFFSQEYTEKWLRMIQDRPDTLFYAYTKMVSMFKYLAEQGALPCNLTMIYSYGGSEDHLIDPNRDRHSQVFQTEAEMIEAGYADTSQDDTVALGANFKVGLVYHGNKNYANTAWDKVIVPK